MVLQVTTQWGSLASTPVTTVMHYANAETTPEAATLATRELWEAWMPWVISGVTADVDGLVKEFDDATGELRAIHTTSSLLPSTGEGSGQRVADATQVLLQWFTGDIVNGRQVRGRQFAPALPVGLVANGNISSPVQAAMEVAVATWLSTATGFVIWHRPKGSPPSGGSVHGVTDVAVWTELAVQRGRRG